MGRYIVLLVLLLQGTVYSVLGINRATKKAERIHHNNPLKTYHITGRFGVLTNNMFSDGKIIYSGRYDFVKRESMDRLLANIQSTHQKDVFDICAVDIDSEAAYQMASKGLIRPVNHQQPVIYGIKCIDFNLPDFTIEISCVNEYEEYLLNLIHEIGGKLRTVAICTSLRCIRHSMFNVQDALLRKHWDLQNVVNNIIHCEELIKQYDKQFPMQLQTLSATAE